MNGLQNGFREDRGKRRFVLCTCGNPLHRVAYYQRNVAIRLWDRWFCPTCGIMYRLHAVESIQITETENEVVYVER